MRRAATRAWPVPSAPFPSSKPTLHTFRSRPYESTFAQPASIFQNIRPSTPAASLSKKNFSTSLRHTKDHAVEAKKLNQKGMDEQEKEVKDQDKKDKKDFDYNNQLDDAVGEARELQARTPWHREGSDKPPVRRMRQASAMTKGKLLTTPSRLLKLILPLTTLDKNSDRKDIEPLALLVHPQQPLSYLERLIQSELPLIRNKKGDGEKVPDVYFRAEDSAQEDDIPDSEKAKREEKGKEEEEGTDEQKIGGEIVKTGKIGGEAKEGKGGEKAAKDDATMADLRGGPGEGGVEVYSGAGRENESADSSTRFVRWSSSTEIGDFIRDAARGKEFAVEIEGASKEIRVGVPSFNDRTHYLRVRLRKTAKELDGLAKIKQECDELAHKSAQRLALSGFGVLLTWWGTIYYLTFQTSYGWDTMEPITYLAGLSTIMLGYLWFLYHNREVSYRAALNLTVSRRQNQLYQAKGFDVARWDALVEEANALRKEIKLVANEYDVDWNEKQDEGSEVVVEALRKERRRGKKKEEEDEGEDDHDDDDDGKGKEKAKKKD